MDLSIWLNIILAIYGAILTTYTIIKSNKEKERQVLVSLSQGWRPRLQNGSLGRQLLFITAANPGNRDVTVNIPSLEMPDGKGLVTPIPLTNVLFPYRLKEGSNCAIWIEMNEVKKSLIEIGYSGKVKLWGKVSDAVGKVYKSKKPLEFDLYSNYE